MVPLPCASAWIPAAFAGAHIQATHRLGRRVPDGAKPGCRICLFLPDTCGQGGATLCLGAGRRKKRSQAGLEMGFIRLLTRSGLFAAEQSGRGWVRARTSPGPSPAHTWPQQAGDALEYFFLLRQFLGCCRNLGC